MKSKVCIRIERAILSEATRTCILYTDWSESEDSSGIYKQKTTATLYLRVGWCVINNCTILITDGDECTLHMDAFLNLIDEGRETQKGKTPLIHPMIKVLEHV